MTMRPRVTASLLLLVALGSARAVTAQLPYRDATLPVAERVRDLVGRMTIDEKFWQLFMLPGDLDNPSHDYSNGVFGLQVRLPASQVTKAATPGDIARAHADRINTIQRYFVAKTRLGIPMIPFEEALHGLVSPGATAFPQAIALAATWDSGLVARVSRAAAREAGSRGIRDVLSPVINLATDVRWGRVEETYGEDPLLTSSMGRAFVAAFEEAGIVATPKHFVANVGDGGRDSYPIDIDQRLLLENFFPPFRTAVGAGHARAVMTAYNSVNGDPATQSASLLNGTLKHDWGFTGFVISDAAATAGAVVLHHTEESTATAAQHAFNSGLDVVFQSSWGDHRPYLEAFRRGLIADSVINAAVSRVLRAKFELGLFERPYVDPDSAAFWNGNARHRALAREAARMGVVLLRNEGGALPLARNARSIAVIGADAVEARLGGYSGPGNAPVSILDGIREAAGAAGTVHYSRGPGRVNPEYLVVPASQLTSTTDGKVTPGWRGEYFDNNALDGTPKLVRTDPRVDFGWTLDSPGRGIPYDWYSVRWSGTLTAPAAGVKQIGVEGNDGYRLWLDGRLVIDNWRKQSYDHRLIMVDLKGGSRHEMRLEYFESSGNARVKLIWDAGVTDWRPAVDSAVSAAAQSDVAIIVAGIEEGEFRDRSSLALPGHQEELIQRVAATGKPVVVVLVGGSAITMSPWLDRVAAVLDVWYPGEEGGHAVADVLFGDANPAGRLPITFPMREGQLPLVYNHKSTGRGDDYLDGTGQPLFPFGFGLSYTTFEYSGLVITPAEIGVHDSAVVRLKVKNSGARAGDEVVQLYLHYVLSSVSQPITRLAAFARITLAPGEEREVTFALGPEQLQLLDRGLHWVVEPGTFRVMIGASSKDIRLRGELVVR